MTAAAEFPVHMDGYPSTACGIESSSASIVSDDILKVTCHDCLAKYYGIHSQKEVS